MNDTDRHGIHIWHIAIDDLQPHVTVLRNLLSHDEVQRAERFRFPHDTSRFIVCRAALRVLLSEVLETSPAALTFSYGAHGKPVIHPDSGWPDIHFSLSHSGSRALVAITRSASIGVDIERIRDNIDGEKIAHRFFSPREAMRLQQVPLPMQSQAFFETWTRKEAYVKARGSGISIPLNQFDAGEPGEQWIATVSDVALSPSEQWFVRNVVAPDGYVAAVCVQGSSCRLLTHQFDIAAVDFAAMSLPTPTPISR